MDIATDARAELRRLLTLCLETAGSQQAWANRLGVDRSNVSRWLSAEEGRQDIPSVAALGAILAHHPEHREALVTVIARLGIETTPHTMGKEVEEPACTATD